ncbi:MAG TPA: glycine/sarcosine/betaine reductase selenoprotein B family protein [Acidimicrobiia bacterium]|nr:glycine/sarcosine/betaine reductase selenoprotein B family protein [Acidimicrobiia bacterium]
MGPPVRYIEKTHDYYRRAGYPKPYKYARFDTTPFTPLDKPLARCRVGLVATAGVTLLDEDGRPAPMKVLGGEEANVVEIPSDTPVERLASIEEHYDRHATTVDDVDAFFPISHLQDLVKGGTIGGVPPRFQKIFPNYSHRVTMSRDAPEVLAQLCDDQVDAALLVPV